MVRPDCRQTALQQTAIPSKITFDLINRGLVMDPLVSHDWLSAHLDDPDLVVIDCTNFADWSNEMGLYRTTSGRDHWADEHIAGSRHADFTTPGFTGDASQFRNTLPDPQDFADAMARLGVHAGARVVLYDDAASLWACRVWWMLRWIGFDKAAVLDGGWQNWDANGGRVSETSDPINPAQLTSSLCPDLFVTRDDVVAVVKAGSVLIDALSEGQFLGREAELGLRGHIPTAINIPGAGLIDLISECFEPLNTLAARFPQDHTKPAIVYCGSGVAAASVAFTMIRLGFEDVAIYMPGLQEWITHPDARVIHG